MILYRMFPRFRFFSDCYMIPSWRDMVPSWRHILSEIQKRSQKVPQSKPKRYTFSSPAAERRQKGSLSSCAGNIVILFGVFYFALIEKVCQLGVSTCQVPLEGGWPSIEGFAWFFTTG
jgi:hypothetical protein